MALQIHPRGGGRSFAPGIAVKVDAGQSPDFAVFERVLPPRWNGPPPHLHREYDEAFQVLDGSVGFRLGGQTHICPAGSFVFVPRGTGHTFANPTAAPARLLVISSPEALSLVEELASLAAEPGGPNPESAAALWARHRSVVLESDGP